jgi:hypothetical protein
MTRVSFDGLWQGYLGTAKRKGRQQTHPVYCYRATFRLYREATDLPSGLSPESGQWISVSWERPLATEYSRPVPVSRVSR